jgi:uncharacterized membrane protein YbhN (UPF0104 family)
MPRRRHPILRCAVGLVATGLLGFFALRRADLGGLRSALGAASLWPLLLAMVLNLGPRAIARTHRTRVLLRAASPRGIPFRDLFLLVLAGGAAGTLIPGPSEEALQTAALRRARFELGDLLAAQLLEKSISILSIALAALLFLPAVGPAGLAVGIGAALLGAVVLYRGRSRRQLAWRPLVEAFGAVVASNLLSVLMMWLCFRAVGARPGTAVCLQIFCATAVAGALPLTPGQVGVLESVFVVTATHLGVPGGTALAVALLYHATHDLPIALAGLPAAIRWGSRLAPAAAATTWRCDPCSIEP